MTDRSLPDGWQRLDEPGHPYYKFVKRDAVTVPNCHRGGGFQRDAVVIVTDTRAGVVKGPGASRSWAVSDPDAAGRALAHEVDDWIQNGGDPYGQPDLPSRLEVTAREYFGPAASE